MLNAEKLIVETEYEDDGLYMITIWVDDDEIGYIAISKDLQGSCPEKIYFEWGDQANGRFVNGFKYSVEGGLLNIDVNDESLSKSIGGLSVNISAFDGPEVDRVLRAIIDN